MLGQIEHSNFFCALFLSFLYPIKNAHYWRTKEKRCANLLDTPSILMYRFLS